MTEGVCIMAAMKEDRGALDLTRLLEDKNKLIDKLRMNMRDYIMMHQTDKDLLGVKIKEVAELRDRLYILEMTFDMYMDFKKTNKSNGKEAFAKFMTAKIKEGQDATQRNDKPDGKDSKTGKANP